MKKQEKTERTRERIVGAAIEEFGTVGYSAAAINNICSGHEISKGLLYHNFSGKDALYLACVSRCFAEVTAYLKDQDIGDDLERYMQLRIRYFSQHPLCARIFFEAVLQPPAPLAAQIREAKADFDCLNKKIYQAALSKMTLRPGVTQDDAIAYYEVMQEMFNGYFSSPAYVGKDLQVLVADHESRLAKMLDFMLYGIAERRIQK